MTIRLYNTLTRQKSDLTTVEPGKVGIYLCGPTVYKESHIGHMVGPVIFDTVKRYLVYSGYKVTLVVNITDVDDKLIAESRRRDISMAAVAEEMTQDYLRNLKSLGVTGIDQMPRATEHIDGIVTFVKDLIAKGKAYAADGDVFFDVTRDADYGKLSNRTADSQQGEGGEAAGKKRSPGDFALWKAAKADEPAWDSPWGPGRPGWHIECSAMSHAILGKTFDIHGGGLDLLFPHHENELAQSESRFDRPMVNYWMHNGLMRASTAAGKVGGRSDRDGEGASADDAAGGKISRSKGAGGLGKLIDKHGGETLRFFLLRTHYRSTIVFDEKELDDSRAALESFHRLFERVQRIAGRSYFDLPAAATRAEGDARAAGKAGSDVTAEAADIRSRFLERMDDDFNTGGATSELFELVRLLNRHADQHKLEDADRRDAKELDAFTSAVAVLKELSGLLGLFATPPKSATAGDGALTGRLIDLILELRQQARQRKDFATSDQIRDTLSGLGVVLEDRKGGTGWRIEAPPAS